MGDQNLTNLSVIRDITKRYNFSPGKKFGQNFIISPHICDKMAREACFTKDITVLEIGTGLGTLTKELSKYAKKVITVEIDERLRSVTAETIGHLKNVTQIFGDVTKMSLDEILPDDDVAVCANLPYYITTPLIMQFLESDVKLHNITVMIQKEVAQRIAAPPGTRECGAISASVRYYGSVIKLFDVSRNCFYPTPDVDSSVIKITVEHNAEKPDKRAYFRIVRTVFSQRRKQICGLLANEFKTDKAAMSKILEHLSISPSARGENLTYEQICRLTDGLV